MLRGKRGELGLGSAQDVSLGDVRKKAEELRAVLVSGRDPAVIRKQTEIKERPKPSFGEVADELIDSIEHGFRNEKHRKQWRSSRNRFGQSGSGSIANAGCEIVLCLISLSTANCGVAMSSKFGSATW